MDRIKEVTFINTKVREEYESLKDGKFEDQELYKYITRAMTDIKTNPLRHFRVPKDLIPQIYVQNYGVESLWKYDLPNGWRLLYTITGDEIKIVSVILEWLDHKSYENRFNY